MSDIKWKTIRTGVLLTLRTDSASKTAYMKDNSKDYIVCGHAVNRMFGYQPESIYLVLSRVPFKGGVKVRLRHSKVWFRKRYAREDTPTYKCHFIPMALQNLMAQVATVSPDEDALVLYAQIKEDRK